MIRRHFITLLGAATMARPLTARAQQSALPVIGFLNGAFAEGYTSERAAFLSGLGEAGYVDGHNVTIKYRWAEGQTDRLPMLANDLVQRQVAVIAATSTPAAVGPGRSFAAAGGLVAYGADIHDAYRLAGRYTGRILKGEKAANLPVQQATKVELIINLKAAKTLGLTVPLLLLGRADEVIE